MGQLPFGSWVCALPLVALAACAPADPAARPMLAIPVVAAGDLPPVPMCRDEMRAYVELTKLAKLHGEGWVVFAPAVDAMKEQVLDCMRAVSPGEDRL